MQDFIVVRELEMDEMEIMHKLEEASAEVHEFQARDLATYQAWKKPLEMTASSWLPFWTRAGTGTI